MMTEKDLNEAMKWMMTFHYEDATDNRMKTKKYKQVRKG